MNEHSAEKDALVPVDLIERCLRLRNADGTHKVPAEARNIIRAAMDGYAATPLVCACCGAALRVTSPAKTDRGAADNFWLVLGSGAVALGALTFLFPILVWPLVVFAAVWMVVAVVSIPFALWLGRRIGGAR